VEELLPPRIPSVFVHAEQGQQLLRHQRSRATVAKADGASSVVGYWVMMVESMVKLFFWIFEGDFLLGM
jgi:hypothetical protein